MFFSNAVTMLRQALFFPILGDPNEAGDLQRNDYSAANWGMMPKFSKETSALKIERGTRALGTHFVN